MGFVLVVLGSHDCVRMVLMLVRILLVGFTTLFTAVVTLSVVIGVLSAWVTCPVRVMLLLNGAPVVMVVVMLP